MGGSLSIQSVPGEGTVVTIRLPEEKLSEERSPEEKTTEERLPEEKTTEERLPEEKQA